MKGWRRLASGVLAAGLLFGQRAAGGDAVALRNPSFEIPMQQENWFSDQAADWERWGDWINRETSWSPTRDGECLIGYHYWKVQGDGSSGILQDLPQAGADRQYVFSIRVFKDTGANMEAIELRLEPSGGGTPMASRVYQVRSMRSKEWQELSVCGRAASPGIRVVVAITPQRGRSRKGALKFDQADLRVLGAQPAPTAMAEVPR